MHFLLLGTPGECLICWRELSWAPHNGILSHPPPTVPGGPEKEGEPGPIRPSRAAHVIMDLD